MIRVERARRCYYPKRWVVISDDQRRYSAEVTYVKEAKEARRLAKALRSYYGFAVPETLSRVRCQECKEPYSLACQIYIHDPDHGTGDYYQTEYLCGEHAAKAGYCPGCGAFIAGISGMGVYCDTCEPEFDDSGEWDEDEEDVCNQCGSPNCGGTCIEEEIEKQEHI